MNALDGAAKPGSQGAQRDTPASLHSYSESRPQDVHGLACAGRACDNGGVLPPSPIGEINAQKIFYAKDGFAFLPNPQADAPTKLGALNDPTVVRYVREHGLKAKIYLPGKPLPVSVPVEAHRDQTVHPSAVLEHARTLDYVRHPELSSHNIKVDLGLCEQEVRATRQEAQAFVDNPVRKLLDVFGPKPPALPELETALTLVGESRKALDGGNPQEARRLADEADRAVRAARASFGQYRDGHYDRAETTKHALEVVRDGSKYSLMALAVIGTGGAATGAAAAAEGATMTGAALSLSPGTAALLGTTAIDMTDVAAHAAAGDKVDWGSVAADIAVTIISSKLGGQGGKLFNGLLTTLMKNPAAQGLAKPVLESAVRDVVTRLINGAEIRIISSTVHALQQALAGKKITAEEFSHQLIAQLTDRKSIVIDMLLGSLSATKLAETPSGNQPTPPPGEPSATHPMPPPEPAAKTTGASAEAPQVPQTPSHGRLLTGRDANASAIETGSVTAQSGQSAAPSNPATPNAVDQHIAPAAQPVSAPPITVAASGPVGDKVLAHAPDAAGGAGIGGPHPHIIMTPGNANPAPSATSSAVIVRDGPTPRIGFEFPRDTARANSPEAKPAPLEPRVKSSIDFRPVRGGEAAPGESMPGAPKPPIGFRPPASDEGGRRVATPSVSDGDHEPIRQKAPIGFAPDRRPAASVPAQPRPIGWKAWSWFRSKAEKDWNDAIDKWSEDDLADKAQVPRATGGQKRRIDGTAIPRDPPVRLDVQHILRRAGETQQQALARVRTVVGTRMSDHPSLRRAWDNARAAVLKTHTLTDQNYPELYNSARRKFWQGVRKDPLAVAIFQNAGFEFSGGSSNAPVFRIATNVKPLTVPVKELRISLDHVLEKAQGDNWKKAIDADNLNFEFQMPNTARENVQARHPELRPAPSPGK